MMGKRKEPQVQPQVEEYLLEMYKALKRVRHLRDRENPQFWASPLNQKQLELEILEAQMWAQALSAQIAFNGGVIFE